VALFALGGCRGHAADSAEPALRADCKAAFIDEAPAPDLTPDELASFREYDPERAAVSRLCTDDAWPPEVAACAERVVPAHAADLEACLKKLSEVQQEHVYRLLRQQAELRHKRRSEAH
jgi:hypothetical protein